MIKNNKNILIIVFIASLLVISAINISKKKEEKFTVIDSNVGDENKDSDLEIIDEEDKAKDVVNIIVHIDGEIKNPGVYTLSYGDRLNDLLELSGGFTNQAETKDINLALILEDEMKIYIPNKNDLEEFFNEDNKTIFSSNESEIKININKASLDELTSLPNIGPSKAEDIISYRTGKKFMAIEDIMQVKGIGEKTFDKLKDLIVVK